MTEEAPMTFLCAALVDVDVETKTAIMKFVNTLLAELQENDVVYHDLMTSLQEDDFEGSYHEALNVLDSACEELAADIGSPSDSVQNLLSAETSSRFGDEKGNDGESNDREVGLDQIFKNNRASSRIFGEGSHRSRRLTSLRRQATRNLNLLDIYKDRTR